MTIIARVNACHLMTLYTKSPRETAQRALLQAVLETKPGASMLSWQPQATMLVRSILKEHHHLGL